MKLLVVRVGNGLLAAIYAALKLLPTNKNKVLFLSRQASEPSLDFRLLQAELILCRPGLTVVTICNRIEPNLKSKASFVADLFRSMYHLATSHVCILDSYWPAVSTLDHKAELVVIQIWHALGKIKQSGLAAVGKPGGRQAGIAKALSMHANYDYIIAGAKAWNPYYCASFGCKEEQLVNIGLPRQDVLISRDGELSEAVYAKYPQLRGKTVVLYAPTFRRTSRPEHSELIAELISDGFALIVKSHPNQDIESYEALTCPEFSAMQLLLVADYLITDYSAIALEAASANVKTLYYLYDNDQYKEQTGVNIDLEKEMPGCVFQDVLSLIEGLKKALAGNYPEEVFRRYQEKYLIPDRGHSTKDLAEFVIKHIEENAD